MTIATTLYASIRFLVALVAAIVLWFTAGGVLVEFEINVRVLQPNTRIVYGIAAFLTGIILGGMILQLKV